MVLSAKAQSMGRDWIRVMFLQGFCKQRFFYNLLENSDDLVLYHIHTSLEHPLHPSHAIQNAFPSPKDIKNNNLNPISSFSKRRRKNKRKGLLRIWNSRVLAHSTRQRIFLAKPRRHYSLLRKIYIEKIYLFHSRFRE